jgi:hypothetical protein
LLGSLLTRACLLDLESVLGQALGQRFPQRGLVFDQ